ncbi:putative amino-acid ABC transporter-binding protein [Saezia sanguinis]|jgi:polar amino acid transport system substrate-binding protein|uniref:Putative amino-acid ABC transporter-binding protein n=1 Tax=Saezia sanguinis TaxID=1965230 RepID=A0A433SHF7_9BURK|nr:transporter substrate-binding domain-containing protein [Saezia sanguinis]RUS68146.1 putative amino-acid ABC transporter-binding protein [Saezia sanguinis]
MAHRRQFLATLTAGGLTAALPSFVFAQGGTESAWDRIQRTKTLRIGAIPGAAPYYHKDLNSGEWQGFMIDFAKNLADKLKVSLDVNETTWGNFVMELQSNRIDIFMGVNPSPERAKAIDITNPLFNNAFVLVARKGFEPKTWEEINQPECKIAVDIGSSHDQFISKMCPNATLIRLKSATEATMAVQSGRADAQVLAIVLALRIYSKNPNIGKIILPQPIQTTTTNIGLRKEEDKRMLEYVNNWIEEIRASGFVQKTVLANLEKFSGVTPDQLPAEISF